MTRAEIIKLAREAGVWFPGGPDWERYAHSMERFAALVAAHERDACVQICIEQACKHPYPSHAGAALTVCADAIRERSQQ